MNLKLVSFCLALGCLGLALIPLYYSLVAALAGLLTRPRPAPEGDLHEGISAVICFVDEGSRLVDTARSFLEATGSFPREVWLSGDCPDPETAELAKALAKDEPRVHLLLSPRRRGKAVCQAQAVRRARYPITLFLDARTRVAPTTPLQLALPLSQPGIAFTTGRLLYESQEGVEEGYWRLEHWVRRYEDSRSGPLGASGGLLACRTREYVACPADSMLDMVLPCLLERLSEGTGRYVETAEAYEPSRRNVASWLRARIRIQARALGSTEMLRGWLAGAGIETASRFLAHKLLRWYASPSLLLVLLFGSFTVAPIPLICLLIAAPLSLSALLATCLPGLPRLPLWAVPGYAVVAQTSGWIRASTGNIPRNWSP